jgi:patatin-related protein
VSDADRYEEEVRLALVLNGGVSLAIWMGGVTCELDRARRAGFPELRKLEDVGVWEQVCRALGTQVTIDVIAGTSAGGLNGAVLAAAIARRAPMPPLREKWKELGDFDRLLIRDDKSTELSVLNGRFFATSIAQVFTKLAKKRIPDIDERQAPSTVALTVTATALHGDVKTYDDQARVPFEQREYRTLYTFRRAFEPDLSRPGRPDKLFDTFAKGTELLPKAARATASFPGAFAPIYPPAPPPGFAEMCSLTQPDWLMDGGVLDNEPFAPVLEEIRKRPVERGTRRVLAYLVPSTGDEPDDPKARSSRTKPGFLTPLWLATSLPRETNILEQLAAVRAMLARVSVDRGTTERLLRRAAKGRTVAGMAANLLPLYRERRYLGGIWQIRETLAAASTATISLRPVPAWTATAEPGELTAPWVPETLDPPDAATDRWQFGLSVAEVMVHNWLDAVRDVLLSQPELASTAAAISSRHRRLVAMGEDFDKAIRASRTRLEADDAAIRTTGEKCFKKVCGDTGERITAEVWAAAEAIVAAKGELADDAPANLALQGGPAEAIRRQLVVAVVQGTFTAPTLDPPVPRFTFRRVGLRQMPGLENAGGRVLYGLALNHFGAFLRSSWRLNDWMWGRLDGCAHVAQVLLDETRLRTLAGRARDELIEDLAAAIGEKERVRAAVNGIAEAGEGADVSAHVGTLRTLLTRRAQIEVLAKELPILRAEVAEADDGTKTAARGWIEALGSEARPSPEALEAAFAKYTLGKATATDVLHEHQGAEGRKVAVLSALRAVRKDETIPSVVHRLAGAGADGLRVLSVPREIADRAGEIADDVGDRFDDVRGWFRDRRPWGD